MIHYGNVGNGRSADGKAAGFPTARKHRFPQLRKRDRLRTFPQRLLRQISFLSYPILIEREKEKEAGVSPSTQTEGGAPATSLNRCSLFYMDFLTMPVVLSFSH